MTEAPIQEQPFAEVMDLFVQIDRPQVGAYLKENLELIRAGGVFVPYAQRIPAGTVVRFTLRLTDDQPVLRGVGQVAWYRDAGSHPGSESGLGLRFTALDIDSLQKVRDLLQRHPQEINAPESTKAFRASAQPRVTIGLDIELRFDDEAGSFAATVLNISHGGMFIRTDRPRSPGKHLSYIVHAPSGSEWRGRAVVAWALSPAGIRQKPRPSGMGITLVEPSTDTLSAIEALISACPALRESDKAEGWLERIGPLPERNGASARAIIQPATGRATSVPDGDKERLLQAVISACLNMVQLPAGFDSRRLDADLQGFSREMLRGDAVDLTLLWNALLSHNEVTVDQAAEVLMTFHLTHADHGLDARFPQAFVYLVRREEVEQRARKHAEPGGSFAKILDSLID